MAERRYWLRMKYGCDGLRVPSKFASFTSKPSTPCDHWEWVYLERGCEGPREVPIEVATRSPFAPSPTVQWFATQEGRPIVPVPFVAGSCPKCGQGMTHIEWRSDERVDITDTELLLGALGMNEYGNPLHISDPPRRFFYPVDSKSPDACGVPSWASREARRAGGA